MNTVNIDFTAKRIAVYVRCRACDNPGEEAYLKIYENKYHHPVSEIYIDEDVAGTSVINRPAFMKMMTDSRNGRIDIIIAESIAVLSRNITVCIRIIDELKNLKEPVGILFEREAVFTLQQ